MKTRLALAARVLAVLAILIMLSPAWAATQAATVQCVVSASYTLQDCINAAADGDTVVIPAGTYEGNFTIPAKHLTLQGSTQGITLLQAPPPSTPPAPPSGGGIVITANSKNGLQLENLTISEGINPNGTGGGIYAAGGTLTVIHCHITQNTAAYGGGIFLDDPASSLTVSTSLIDYNEAKPYIGGGIYAKGSASITSSTLDHNTAVINGGGLHGDTGLTTLSGDTFTNNQAQNGNGGAANVNNALTITNSTFSSNSAALKGGAVLQWNGPFSVTISGSTFSSNTVSNATAEVQGGGAYIVGSLSVANTTFTGNKADTLTSGKDVRGGGLYAAGVVSVEGAIFSGNQTLCNTCSYNQGGGLWTNQTGVPAMVSHSTFDGNKGWSGAGIFGTNLNVTHSTFKNAGGGNTSGYGGGIEAVTLTGDDLLFQDNHVANEGGAVHAAHITLTHSRFIRNSMGYGGAISAHGTMTGSNLLFDNNQANQPFGGALLLNPNTTATLTNITIAQALPGNGPAIYLEASAVLNLYNSIVNNYTDAIQLSGTTLSGSTLNEDYNLFYGNGVDIRIGPSGIYNPGGHSITTSPPDFFNPAAGNYHLLYSSKAIGGGYNYGLSDDLDFYPRAGRTDIGAYQGKGVFLPLVVR